MACPDCKDNGFWTAEDGTTFLCPCDFRADIEEAKRALDELADALKGLDESLRGVSTALTDVEEAQLSEAYKDWLATQEAAEILAEREETRRQQ